MFLECFLCAIESCGAPIGLITDRQTTVFHYLIFERIQGLLVTAAQPASQDEGIFIPNSFEYSELATSQNEQPNISSVWFDAELVTAPPGEMTDDIHESVWHVRRHGP